MHVFANRGLTDEISAEPRADLKARKVTSAQSRVVLSDTAARERAIIDNGRIVRNDFRVRRHSYDRDLFYSSWMALLLASRVCCRFRRVGRVSM
jgi:hypothetical protein